MSRNDRQTVLLTLPELYRNWKNVGLGRTAIRALDINLPGGGLYRFEARRELAPAYYGKTGSMHRKIRWVLYRYSLSFETWDPVEHPATHGGGQVAADTLLNLSRWIKNYITKDLK